MKWEILNGTFDQASIDAIIDKDLSDMFNPKINVTDQTKSTIRKHAHTLSASFLEIIAEYGKPELEENYIDDIFKSIDKFVVEYERTLSNIPDKYISSSVGIIWSGMFATLSTEFKNSPDWLTFQYGSSQLMEILLKKAKNYAKK